MADSSKKGKKFLFFTQVNRFNFAFKNVLSPFLTLLLSAVFFFGGWYVNIYGGSPIGSAYWMIGLIGFYLSYKSFKNSKFFSFGN